MSEVQDQEITLRDIILVVKSYIRDAFRYWWHLLIIVAVVLGIFLYRAWSTPVTYRATFTFMRDTDGNSGMGAVSSILGQFGLGGGRNRFNLDRVLELAKSRRVVDLAMFDTCVIDSREDFIANHIITIYELDEQWAKTNEDLKDFQFSHGQVAKMNELELKAARRVYTYIVGNENREGLISAGYSDDSGILSLSAITLNEDLSIELIKSVYEYLADYYVQQVTSKQKATYEIVKTKSDSIAAVLSQLEVEYAKFRDANQGLYSNLSRVREQQLSREITKLNIVHAEALKNVEIADFSLRNATPIIQELDEPIKPLAQIQESVVKNAIIGIALGGLLAVVYLVMRRLIILVARVEPDV